MNTLELNVTELSFDELRSIDGGEPISLTTTAGVTVALAIIGGAYLAGEKVGEALYHYFN